MFHEKETAKLCVYDIKATDAGTYTCKAVNELGQTETSGKLIVEKAEKGKPKEPKVEMPPEAEMAPEGPAEFLLRLKDQTVKLGESVTHVVTSKCKTFIYLQLLETFYCYFLLATCRPEPVVTWFKNGEPVDLNDTRYKIVHDFGRYQLQISSVDISDQCEWKATGVNVFGTCESSCKLTVTIPAHMKKPSFKKGLQDMELPESSALKLEVKLQAVPPPDVSW